MYSNTHAAPSVPPFSHPIISKPQTQVEFLEQSHQTTAPLPTYQSSSQTITTYIQSKFTMSPKSRPRSSSPTPCPEPLKRIPSSQRWAIDIGSPEALTAGVALPIFDRDMRVLGISLADSRSAQIILRILMFAVLLAWFAFVFVVGVVVIGIALLMLLVAREVWLGGGIAGGW